MRAVVVFCLIAMIICLITPTEGNYRKPPFNGSIFGKRGNTENDATERAMSALCEIASETCQMWFSQTSENKK
ncbi:FMRFamide-related neuropeptide [Papilio xuthus]|nr:FMRFamide-related neuropeptide [Papilio xuthus]